MSAQPLTPEDTPTIEAAKAALALLPEHEQQLLLAWLDAARARIAKLEHRYQRDFVNWDAGRQDARRERDEARAERDRANALAADWMQERDLLRAEVERLKAERTESISEWDKLWANKLAELEIARKEWAGTTLEVLRLRPVVEAAMLMCHPDPMKRSTVEIVDAVDAYRAQEEGK